MLNEADIPFLDAVKSASEMLGIDPLEITNEGKVVMAVDPEKCQDVLTAIRKTKYGKNARIIGDVVSDSQAEVVIETLVGGKRLLEPPIGISVTRIC